MQSRRDFLKTMAGAVSWPVLNRFAGAADSQSGKQRPAIVVFVADDHGYFDSKVYGSIDVRTPHMQRLADNGLTFTNAFVASPSCAPSRAAMLTGLMPARNGAEANHTYPRPEIKQLPWYMKQLGYETAAFGKVAHGAARPAHEAGFDHVNRGGSGVDSDAIDRYLKTRDPGKGLCLFIGCRWTHVQGPWPENEHFDPRVIALPPNMYDNWTTRQYRTRYLSAVEKLDRDMGQAYALVRRHFGDNAVFIYTSDHGSQWPFGKWNLYDVSTRTPLLVEWPGVIKPGQKTDAMVSWVDFLPTFIEIAGGKPPTDIDGQSFLGLLQGQNVRHREEIFTTHSGDGRMNVYPIRSIRTERYKYILNLRPDCYYTTHIDLGRNRDGLKFWYSWVKAAKDDPRAGWLVNRYHVRPEEELYDLLDDPYELTNLADVPEHREILKQLRQRLTEWMEAQGDTKAVFEEPYPRSKPKPVSPLMSELLNEQ